MKTKFKVGYEVVFMPRQVDVIGLVYDIDKTRSICYIINYGWFHEDDLHLTPNAIAKRRKKIIDDLI